MTNCTVCIHAILCDVVVHVSGHIKRDQLFTKLQGNPNCCSLPILCVLSTFSPVAGICFS